MEKEIRMNFNDVKDEEKREGILTNDIRRHLFRMLLLGGNK